MSEKTESPALLSPEGVQNAATYAEWLKGKEGFFADYGPLPDEMNKTSASLLSALLADRAAFRQQVADELRLLLYDESIFPQLSQQQRTACFIRNTQVKNVARALKIDLLPA